MSHNPTPAPNRCLVTTLTAALLLPACLGDVGGVEPEGRRGVSTVGSWAASPYTFHSRNIVAPRVGWGKLQLRSTSQYDLWAEGCDGTAAEDTLLLLLDAQGAVVASNDDGGAGYPGGCSHLSYQPSWSGSYSWEVWRKPRPKNPTRLTTAGLVDIKLNEVDLTAGKGSSSDQTRTLVFDAPVNGSAVGGFALHDGSTITALRPSRADRKASHPRLLLLDSATGAVLDHDAGGATERCATCARITAPAGTGSSTTAVLLVGTRDRHSGQVDLRLGQRKLRGKIPLTAATPALGQQLFGPRLLTGMGSFVVQLSYATRVAVGDKVGHRTVTRSGGRHSGFERYAGSSAKDRMFTATLDICSDASCSSYEALQSTTRYRGHFGAANTTAPVFLQSHYGDGYYRVRVSRLHSDVYRTAAPAVYNDATNSQVTTLGNWNIYMDTTNLSCGGNRAPAAQVWTRYRNDIDLMAFQEVEYQCHFNLLKQRSEAQDNKAWEFFYTRGDTYTTNCDDDYVGLLIGQRLWPDLQAGPQDLAGRGRGKEFGRDKVSWFDTSAATTRSVKCWKKGGWSMLCDSSKGEPKLDFFSGNRDNDPSYPKRAMGCRMRPDTDGGNEYPHAMTARIRPTDGPADGSRDIVVVVAHQIDFGSGDDPDDGGGYSHIKTYLEDLPALVYGTYGPNVDRIMYIGDLNMWESAHEWETMLRKLRGKFGYAIDTRLIQHAGPLSTWAGYGKDCSYQATGGQNDGVILLGQGWSKLDPAVSVGTEDWSAKGTRGGRIEYRAPKEECKYFGLSCTKPVPDCVPRCSGTPETGCVNNGDPVLATDHSLLITKVRTAL